MVLQVARRRQGKLAVYGPQWVCRKARKTMFNRMREFLVSEDGPTATEYAVMLALIIVVAIAAVTLLGQSVRGVFENVNSQIEALPAG